MSNDALVAECVKTCVYVCVLDNLEQLQAIDTISTVIALSIGAGFKMPNKTHGLVVVESLFRRI